MAAKGARRLPGNGAFLGWLGLLGFGLFAVLTALDGWRPFLEYGSWGLLLAVASYAAAIRPAVWLSDEALTLRGMVSTTTIPLADIDRVVIRQTLAVFVGEQIFRSSAVGRYWRKVATGSLRGNASAGGPSPASRLSSDPADIAENLINSALAAGPPATEGGPHQVWARAVLSVFAVVAVCCLAGLTI